MGSLLAIVVPLALGANTTDFRCLRFAEVLRLLCSVCVVESVSRMASSA